MPTYPGAITLSERTLAFLAGLLQAHREQLRTWRKLSASNQALLVLAHLRHGDTYARLAVGFGVGVATVLPVRSGSGCAAGRAGSQPDRRPVGAGLDLQQLCAARRHAAADRPDRR